MAIDKNTIEIKQEDTYTIEIKQEDTFEIQLNEQGPQGNRGFTGNGIATFELTSSNVLTDTYTITFTDGETTTIDVENGRGISNIELTSSSGLTDTYTITYNDNTTSTFNVYNGNGIDYIAKTGTNGLNDVYTIYYTNGNTDTFEVPYGNVNIEAVANDLENIDTVANMESAIGTVVSNIDDIDNILDNMDKIDTVSQSISAIGTVATNISDVEIVSGSISTIGTVSADLGNINSVAGSLSSINSVSSNLTNINAVASNETNINAVNSNKTNIDTVADNTTNINAVNSNKANIDTVATNISDINSVKDNLTNISTVADSIEDVGTVADNITDINSVADDLTNINTVVDNLTDIDTVITNISDIKTVSGSISAIGTVSANITDIETVADNLTNINNVVSDLTNIDAVANNETNINAVNSNKANIDTVATNISNINNVADDLTNINAIANDLINIDNASSYADLAEDWANKMDGPVDGNEFSAKYYAQQSSQSQIQSNWNETNPSSKAYIQNKPDIIKDITINDVSIVDDNGYADINVTGDNNIDVSFTSAPSDIDVSGTGSITLDNAKANGLNSVTLSGGCAQNGTPTPANPVNIVCNNGVLNVSPNLFNKDLVPDVNEYINKSNGNAASPASGEFRHSDFIVIKENTQYYVGIITSIATSAGLAFYDDTKTYISGISLTQLASDNNIITSPNYTKYIRFSFRIDEGYNTNWQNTVYLVEGNQPLAEFMPYGAIYTDGTQEVVTDSLGNTANAEMLLSVRDYKDTQEVISGSVTRNIGIKVLDGTENWTLSSVANTYLADGLILDNDFSANAPACVCSHLVGTTPNKTATEQDDNSLKVGYSNAVQRYNTVFVKSSNFANVSEWSDWLATQYANGTPVIVVYPLATATTETVTGQPLTIQAGTNIVEITQASISNLPISANYDSLNGGKNLEISFTNGSGYIKGINGTDVTTALGYTPVNPSSLSTVATTGSYNDLSGKPTIPTVNNATLTIQKNGTTVNSFTANASSDVTCNITVPTATSDLTNDSNFILNTTNTSSSVGILGTINGTNSVTVGSYAQSRHDYCTAVGSYAYANYLQSTAIGYGASANGQGSIQIGYGTNSTEKTLSIGFGKDNQNNDLEYQLLDGTTGKIPDDRINSTIARTSNLSTVATSGSYNDLSDKPTIPTNTNQLINGAGFITASDVPTEIFVATYGTTTFADVLVAYNAGKIIECKRNIGLLDDDTFIYKLIAVNYTGSNITTFYFTMYNSNKGEDATLDSTNGWSATTNYLENKHNKVTSLSSSSTDTQYPSAKCVYDAIPTVPTTDQTFSKTSTNPQSGTAVLDMLQTIYPVGSVYLSTNSTCPLASLFGTWTLVSSGKALWTGTSTNGGTTISAGLPNISGSPDGFRANNSYQNQNYGAFTWGTIPKTSGGSGSGNYSSHAILDFSARNSNTIYGNSSTVQPPAYVVNVWKRTA